MCSEHALPILVTSRKVDHSADHQLLFPPVSYSLNEELALTKSLFHLTLMKCAFLPFLCSRVIERTVVKVRGFGN